MQYYMHINGQQVGPFDESLLMLNGAQWTHAHHSSLGGRHDGLDAGKPSGGFVVSVCWSSASKLWRTTICPTTVRSTTVSEQSSNAAHKSGVGHFGHHLLLCAIRHRQHRESVASEFALQPRQIP